MILEGHDQTTNSSLSDGGTEGKKSHHHDEQITSKAKQSLRSYVQAVSQMLLEDCGPVVSRAVYDIAAIPEVVLSFPTDESGDASLLGPIAEVWRFYKGVVPEMHEHNPLQRQTAHQLILLKRTTSLAIGRIHRDMSLASMYDKASPSTGQQRVVVKQVRRAVRAMVNHFFIGLQMIIDVIPEKSALRHALAVREPWQAYDCDTDPMLLLMSATHATSTVANVEHLLKRIARKDDALDDLKASTSRRTAQGAFVRSHVLEYHRQHAGKIGPHTGKLWNYFRPTSGCSSLTRTCEEPEACRLVCNLNYLIGAGPGKVHHRFIGFGSNNDFGWEETTGRFFQRLNHSQDAGGQESSSSFRHGIRSMTTLDCTVKEWRIPRFLKEQNNYFTGRVCVDQVTTLREGKMRIDGLKQLVLSGEQEKRPVEGSHARDNPAATEKSLLELQGMDATIPTDPSFFHEYFDDVAVFKVDVEGHEHSLIPGWAKLEMLDLKKSLGSAFTTELLASRAKSAATRYHGDDDSAAGITMIDFEHDVPSFFTVSMFQLEIHERADATKQWYFDQPALQGFRMQQYLATLGFVQISAERNAWGDCCFEMVYAHYRFLIRSEVWNTLHGP